MKEYKIIVPEYVSFAKRKIDMTYTTKTETLDEAINNLYSSLKNYGWTRERVREAIA